MKVVCIGELLIDFVCTEQNIDLANGKSFVKEAGGAPANVAACVSRLGGEAHFIGSVGNDPLGTFLSDMLEDFGVKTEYLNREPTPTTLAFVSLFENGERDFVFNRGADEKLSLDNDVISELCDDAILHFGSATALLSGELLKSYGAAANYAKSNGNLICFDPNYRVDLWRGKETEFIEKCNEFLLLADIVKVSEEELTLLTGIEDQVTACKKLHEFGVAYVLVTLGSKGCRVSDGNYQVIVPAYEIDAVDTTGAGDSFIGAMLYQLANRSNHEVLSLDQMVDYIAFAGKVGGVVCSKLGAMSSLPTLDEVKSKAFKVKA